MRRPARLCHPAEDVDDLPLQTSMELVPRLVRPEGEDDEIRRAVSELLAEVRLVPGQHVDDARAVDAEGVERDAGLGAVEGHRRKTRTTPSPARAAARGGGGRSVTSRARTTRRGQRPARRDPPCADAVHQEIDGAALRLLEVRDLEARGRGRREIGPRPGAVLARDDGHADEAVHAVPDEPAALS